jgi:hypothetical protein
VQPHVLVCFEILKHIACVAAHTVFVFLILCLFDIGASIIEQGCAVGKLIQELYKR